MRQSGGLGACLGQRTWRGAAQDSGSRQPGGVTCPIAACLLSLYLSRVSASSLTLHASSVPPSDGSAHRAQGEHHPAGLHGYLRPPRSAAPRHDEHLEVRGTQSSTMCPLLPCPHPRFLSPHPRPLPPSSSAPQMPTRSSRSLGYPVRSWRRQGSSQCSSGGP